MSEQPAFHPDLTQVGCTVQQSRTDAANTSANLFQNEVYGNLGSRATFNPYRFDGSHLQGQTQPGRDVYGYSGGDQHPVATDNSHPGLEQARKVLTDASSSAVDKLHVVQALAKAGTTQIDLPDTDGKMRTYSVRTGQIGDKTMVHLFANDDQGKEHIVLRGVINQSGSFDKEHDNSGPVDFEGTWWQEHMAGRSQVGVRQASEQDQTTDQNRRPDRYYYGGGGHVVCRIRRDSGSTSDTTNGTIGNAQNYVPRSSIEAAPDYANQRTSDVTNSAGPQQTPGSLQHLKEAIARARNGGRRLNVVQIGDSHVAAGTETEEIAAKLGGYAPITYTHKGVNGSTAAQANRWVNGAVDANTDLVIVSFGSNDSVGNVNASNYAAGYQGLIARIKAQAPNATILMVGPTDGAISGRPGTELPGLDGVIAGQRAVAANTPNSSFFDIRSRMGSIATMRSQGLLASDNLHFTNKGYRAIGDQIADYIQANL